MDAPTSAPPPAFAPVRSVLITGAALRVGRAFALGLAKEGWAVAVHYNRSAKPAEALAALITSSGGKAVAIGADLTNEAHLESLIAAAHGALGMPLGALINNASTFNRDSVQSFSREVYDDHMQVNLYAPLRLSKDFAAHCEALGHEGVIINMLDQRLLRPDPEFFTYAISKSGLHWATQTMAQAFAPRVRVNAIGPGPSLANIHDGEEGFAKEAAGTLLGRGSPPETLLEAARYLLSARSVTGQLIVVDGGQHLNFKAPL